MYTITTRKEAATNSYVSLKDDIVTATKKGVEVHARRYTGAVLGLKVDIILATEWTANKSFLIVQLIGPDFPDGSILLRKRVNAAGKVPGTAVITKQFLSGQPVKETAKKYGFEVRYRTKGEWKSL